MDEEGAQVPAGEERGMMLPFCENSPILEGCTNTFRRRESHQLIETKKVPPPLNGTALAATAQHEFGGDTLYWNYGSNQYTGAAARVLKPTEKAHRLRAHSVLGHRELSHLPMVLAHSAWL